MDWKNTIKMAMPPKAVHKFSAISVKIPTALFTGREQTMLQLVHKHKTRKAKAKAILRKDQLGASHANFTPQ